MKRTVHTITRKWKIFIIEFKNFPFTYPLIIQHNDQKPIQHTPRGDSHHDRPIQPAHN